MGRLFKFNQWCNPYHKWIRMIYVKNYFVTIQWLGIVKHGDLFLVNKTLNTTWINFILVALSSVQDTEENGTLIVKIGPEIRKLCYIYFTNFETLKIRNIFLAQ